MRGLCAALEANGLKQVLDIVPNHMAIGGRENPWWWDVLENGQSSRYASYFDVEWDPPEVQVAQYGAASGAGRSLRASA